jgi:AraC-like DNA-binding protein/mannose-6-phosphate isomerase-like protein (cupin superfamily)
MKIPSILLSGISYEENFNRHQLSLRIGSFIVFDDKGPTNHLHLHNCYELCFVLEGSGDFKHNGIFYKLGPGTIFIAAPNVLHEISSFISKDLLLFFYTMEIKAKPQIKSVGYEDKLLDNFLKQHQVAVHKKMNIMPHFQFIAAYSRTTPDHWLRIFLRNLFMECLEQLTVSPVDELLSNQAEKLNTTIDEAIRYIGRNLHRKIYLDELGRHCCTSPRNLQLLFKKHLMTTVTGFINEKKAIVAANRLLMGVEISRAGEFIGINDSAQFSRFFKKYHKISPRDYLKKYAPQGMRFAARHIPGST